MQEALNKAKESSKIEVLNSYVVLLKKEMSYKEHLLKAGYFINKANIMSGINEFFEISFKIGRASCRERVSVRV